MDRIALRTYAQRAALLLLALFSLTVLGYYMSLEGGGTPRNAENAFTGAQKVEATKTPEPPAGPAALPAFPEERGMELAGESGRWLLLADPRTGHFLVEDRETGKKWRSYPNPEGWAEEGVTVVWKSRMLSPFMLGYVQADASQDLDQTTDWYAENGQIASFELLDNGFRVRYRLDRFETDISVEVLLKDGYVETRLPADGMSSRREDISIISLRLFPFFGAETSKQDGFLFIPDGSGALIDFKEDQPGSVSYYYERIYGEDRAYSYNQLSSDRLPARLPVFGIRSVGQAFLGVVHEGAGHTALLAAPSRSFTPYNWATPEYTFRYKYFQPTTTARDQGVYAYSPDEIRAERVTRYYLLPDDEADYPEMAAAFRNYLLEEAGLRRLADDGSKLPLRLALLGADTAEGFLRDRALPLTTAVQAMDIVQELDSLGVEAMSITYKGWENDGYSKYGAHFPVSPAIGGNEGMERFVRFAHAKGYEVLLDAESYSYNNTGADSFRRSRDALRDLSSTVIDVITPSGKEAALVAPRLMHENLIKDLEKAERLGIDGFLFGGALGSRLDSDFNRRRQTTREESLALQRDAASRTAAALGAASVSQGSFYLIDLAGHVDGLTSDTSHDMFVTRSVPFAQIALHGLVTYTLGYANLSDDYRNSFLKGIEYGAEPSFLIAYAPPSDLLRSKSLQDLYSVHFRDWLVEMVSMYQRYNEAMGGLRGSFITDHRQLADGVYETNYEDGTKIIVNYNETPYVSEGRRVDAGEFAVEKGGTSR